MNLCDGWERLAGKAGVLHPGAGNAVGPEAAALARIVWGALVLPALLILAPMGACSDDSVDRQDASVDVLESEDAGGDAAVDGSVDAGPQLPGILGEICAGRSPDETAESATLSHITTQTPSGSLQGLQDGDVEAVGFVPQHPLRFDHVRLYLAGSGRVELHVWGDWFRSEPDLENDLVEPLAVDVSEEGWVDWDLCQMIMLDPSRRFWVGLAHVSGQVQFYLAEGEGDWSRFKSPSLIDPPFVWSGIGGGVEYMVEVVGEYFCPRQDTYFVDVTAQSGLADTKAGRIAVGDLDGDGNDDLAFHLTAGSDRPELWRSTGGLEFERVTDQAFDQDTHSNFAVWGDLDNDGDQDLYLGVYTPQDGSDPGWRSSVWLNDGAGHFSQVVQAGVDLPATSAAGALADYDGDGVLDLYVGNWLVHYPDPPAMDDFLFHGLGDGTFEEVSEQAGVRLAAWPCYGVTWCDVNDDGLPDILVANYGYAPNMLFLNEGDGTFDSVGRDTGLAMDPYGGRGGNTFGIDCGDYDNDGHLDLFVAEIAHPRYQPWSDPSRMLRWAGSNDEPGFQYIDVTEAAGIPHDEGMIDPSWVDYDNDGDLDLFVSVLYPGHASRLFRNEGDGTFVDVTYLAGLDVPDGQAGVWADFDGDGDMDLVTTNRQNGGTIAVWENRFAQTSDSSWLELRLVGNPPSNLDAIGARVTARTGEGIQIREVKGGKGHNNTASTRMVHFGFGSLPGTLDIEIRWPSGLQERFAGIESNQRLTLTEGQGEEM